MQCRCYMFLTTDFGLSVMHALVKALFMPRIFFGMTCESAEREDGCSFSTGTDVQSFLSKELHSLLFLEEFVFSRNKVSPALSTELELADAVVLLGDVLLIYQIKERAANEAGDVDAERRWFKDKVLGRATKQVRDTLRFRADGALLHPAGQEIEVDGCGNDCMGAGRRASGGCLSSEVLKRKVL